MKRITDMLVMIVWVVVLLFLCTTFLTQCSMMYGNTDFSYDNLKYYSHNIFHSCFASSYTWPSGENEAALNIPDSCDGYRVTALGGYTGSGGPCPFSVILPNSTSVLSGCSDNILPHNARVEQYHLTLNIGKHLREDKFIVMDDYHKVGTNQFVQILVTVNCSPKNPYFYSENGKLYKRSDNSLVEGFFYYSDYCE